VASHDLKEPLRGLTINANFLMREGDLSEVGKERVARMVALCHRMEQLISDLLFFSRLSRSSTSLEDVDPAQIITALRVSLTEVLDERGGSISIATELPLVHAESAKIKTVFQNLIVNGVKYNDAVRKVVTVGFKSTVEIGDQVYRDMFYVSDNGIGISENNREKIFGIFSRLNSEKAYGAGTGAGLAFVKKIIEDYGGEITCQSRPGNGSTFYFSLPIARHAETPTLRPVQRAAG
jgi:light-regulated signal transduction histidine kinase (bacteriophytochrome)